MSSMLRYKTRLTKNHSLVGGKIEKRVQNIWMLPPRQIHAQISIILVSYFKKSTQYSSFIDGSLESRETQTYDVDSISLQTRVDMCTQVAWKFIGDAYISTKNDHIITSKGHYVTAAEKETMLLQSVSSFNFNHKSYCIMNS